MDKLTLLLIVASQRSKVLESKSLIRTRGVHLLSPPAAGKQTYITAAVTCG